MGSQHGRWGYAPEQSGRVAAAGTSKAVPRVALRLAACLALVAASLTLAVGGSTSATAATLPCAANLLAGGDFGTLTGTTTHALVPAPTGYAYNGGSLSAAGSYAVMSWNSSVPAHPATTLWDGLAGHTTGNDDDAYVGVNGSTAQAVFFSRTVTDLLAGVTYDAGVWATNATQAPTAQAANTLPDFGVRIRRTDTNAIVAQADTGALPSHIGAPGTRLGPSAWTQTTATFVTDPNPAVDYTVEFYNISRQSSGNDFAFDDLSLNAKVCPGMTVDKQAVVHDSNTDGLTDAGDTIDYSVVVTNTGDSQLTALNLTDPMLSGAGLTLNCPLTTLAAGASTTCTASGPYTVTAADAVRGSVDNTAQASATTADARTLTDSDTVSTAVQTVSSGLSIVKSSDLVNPATQYVAGHVVTYSFVITNTGNVTLTAVKAVETSFTGSGTAPVPSCPAAAASVAPGAQVTCTATYTLTPADIVATQLDNQAEARGTTPGGAAVVSAPSSLSIPAPPVLALNLVKSVSPATATAREQVTYTFKLTNAGNRTLSAIDVTESAFTGNGSAPTPTCPPGDLTPGGTKTCTATYTVTQADFDAQVPIANTAHATATDPLGTTVLSNDSSASLNMGQPTAALDLVKSASPSGPATFTAGEVITYSFLVTNTGNVTLLNAQIHDGAFTGTGTLPTPTCPAGAASLAPGQQVVCTTSYTLTQADVDSGSVTNAATATAVPSGPTAPPVPPASTVTIPQAAAPAVSLVKATTTTALTAAGQLVDYTFTVTNTGNVTLTNPEVIEGAFSGVGTVSTPACPATSSPLLPGQVTVCTASYSAQLGDLTGTPLVNTATVSATDPGGASVASAPSTARINNVANAPAGAPPTPVLAATGVAIGGAVAAAGTLLIVGLVLLFVRRRRRATH